MTLFKTADGSTRPQCDGCGRIDAGNGSDFSVKEYAVHDANVGGTVTHHYCTHCASNRSAQLERLEVPQAPNQFANVSGEPEAQLAEILPAPVDEAAAAAEEIEASQDQ